jgi:hypothetical protein
VTELAQRLAAQGPDGGVVRDVRELRADGVAAACGALGAVEVTVRGDDGGAASGEAEGNRLADPGGGAGDDGGPAGEVHG